MFGGFGAFAGICGYYEPSLFPTLFVSGARVGSPCPARGDGLGYQNPTVLCTPLALAQSLCRKSLGDLVEPCWGSPCPAACPGCHRLLGSRVWLSSVVSGSGPAGLQKLSLVPVTGSLGLQWITPLLPSQGRWGAWLAHRPPGLYPWHLHLFKPPPFSPAGSDPSLSAEPVWPAREYFVLSGQLWAPPASCRGHPALPRSPWLYSDSHLSLLRFLQALPQTQLFWGSRELVSERRDGTQSRGS